MAKHFPYTKLGHHVSNVRLVNWELSNCNVVELLGEDSTRTDQYTSAQGIIPHGAHNQLTIAEGHLCNGQGDLSIFGSDSLQDRLSCSENLLFTCEAQSNETSLGLMGEFCPVRLNDERSTMVLRPKGRFVRCSDDGFDAEWHSVTG